MFFSHNNSVGTVFFSQFQPSFRPANGDMSCSPPSSPVLNGNRRSTRLCPHTPDPRSIATKHHPWYPPHLCGLTTTIPRPHQQTPSPTLPIPATTTPPLPAAATLCITHLAGTTAPAHRPPTWHRQHLHITEMNGHVMGTEAIPYGPFIFSGQR